MFPHGLFFYFSPHVILICRLLLKCLPCRMMPGPVVTAKDAFTLSFIVSISSLNRISPHSCTWPNRQCLSGQPQEADLGSCCHSLSLSLYPSKAYFILTFFSSLTHSLPTMNILANLFESDTH